MKTSIREKGFTMVEILTVVVLLGILAAMVLPRLTGQTDKARAAEAINIMGAIRQAEEAYRNGPAGDYLFPLDWNCGASPEWVRLSLGDPNCNSQLFKYIVVGGGPGEFVIWGIKMQGATTVCQIYLNQSGTWASDGNPECVNIVPTNPAGAICDDTCSPSTGTACPAGSAPGPCG